MQNLQFDLTDIQLVQSFNVEQFRLFCSKNGKESNLNVIINQKLTTIIQTATKIKRQNQSDINENKVFHENKNKKNRVCPTWAFSEYKFFTYVTYLYSFLKRVDLVDLTSEDLKNINSYFLDKPFSFIYFEFKYLQKIKKEKWTNIEDDLLIETIHKINPKAQKISWKIIAYNIFLNSDMKIFRTYKDCRERWANHLNPQVNRNGWTLQEDRKLFQLIIKEGKKWSKLVQRMNSTRTQHMIKNRYNSYLRKWRRILPNRKEQIYMQEILNHLTTIDQKDQPNYFNNFSGKQVSFQQKKSKVSRSSRTKKHTKIQKTKSQAGQLVEDQHSSQIKMEVEAQSIQQIKQSSEEYQQVKQQEVQRFDQSQLKQEIKIQNEFQKMECIPEYRVMLEGREEVNLINTLPEHVQNYLQRDPNFIKMVDDTWLSELQEKQNMKWLEWLQE